ncbi:Heat shock 70 kDa protein cognate 4 [Orchesella cincta]|uniref:Heat shock 70 kDa protein cognate 4 n=1 Tax=Orchesella cincta TaxID=48709 RepID=A0A1D2MB75_ORCCI|nr:Heat shock 70 kDa protein cognate 4 [Orchesella cincta]
MKKAQDHIRRHLSELITLTKCDTLLLSELTSFLSVDDEDCLNGAYRILLEGAKLHFPDCLVYFQGREHVLREIMKNLGKEMIENITKTLEADDDFILYMIDNKRPIIINNVVPAKISYYIPRKLTPRHRIDPAVFDKNCTDIFVIKHIKLSDLSLLAKRSGTSLSSNITNKLTARFILLDYAQDYDRICHLSLEPVHLLEYTTRKQYIWIKSYGDISNLQKYIHKNQDDQSEETFLLSCLQNMNLRLQKASKNDKESDEDKMELFHTTHMRAAVQLLFPKDYDKLKDLFAVSRKVETRELCEWGFLEINETDDRTIQRFTHRTFAEYFIGLFVTRLLKHLEEFGDQHPEQAMYLDFLHNTVLSTTQFFDNPLGSCKMGKWDLISSSTFTHPVICFFINAHLSIQGTGKTQRLRGPFKLYDILAACINHDYASLLHLVVETTFINANWGLDNRQLSNLTLLAAKYASLDIFMIMHQQLLTNKQKPLFLQSVSPEFIITPLHVAAARGNFCIFEFWLRYAKSVHGMFQELKYVVHCCVSETLHDDATITIKMEILQLISKTIQSLNRTLNTNIDWINEPLPDGTTPLLQNRVHFKIIKTLIKHECEADVNAISDQGCILHKLIENEITPQIFHQMVLSLLKYNFKEFNSRDAKKRTPLHAALARVEIWNDTFRLFEFWKADLDAKDDQGNSIFFYAVRANRSVALLETLISHGSDFTEKNDNLDNVLHVCARHGNVAAFQYFLQSDKFCMDELNAANKEGITPFIEALTNGKGLEVSLIKEMEEKGFSIIAKLASDGLKGLLCNNQIMAWELNSKFVDAADYLMNKGGVITCKNAASPWELEATVRNIDHVAKMIQVTDVLLKELQKRGLEVGLMQPQNSLKFIQSTLLQQQNTYERLCVSLIASKQIHPFLLLKQYLKSDVQESIKFVTPINDIIKFMQSEEDQLIIIRSRNNPLTLTRLKNTIDPDILIITADDLNKELPDVNLTVYHSKTAENDAIQNLKNLNRKIICVFSIINKEVEQHNEVHSDDIVWADLAADFQSNLILHSKVTSEISDLPLGSHQSSKPEELVDFICKNDHSPLEVLEIINQHIAEYLNQNTSFEFLKIPQTAITNLHVAVRKGYPVITKFLLNLKSEAELQELKYLLHFCIVDSQYESEKQIACKERIIELLSKKNKHWVNEKLPNGTLPLLQRNVHKRLVECLAKNGADNEKVLAFGKGLTVEVIKIMEDQGLQLTRELSSDTLMNLICNKQIMAWELDRNFIQVADYLIYKGARLLCKNGKSPWKMETVQKNMSIISKCINHNEALQNELINRITNEMKQIAQSDCLHEKWESLQHKRSFERLCISLIACGQVEPYTLLKLCIQSDTNEISKFITPPIGIAQLFLRKTCNVVVLKSLNMQVSTTRIQDTVDSDAVVFSEADLNTGFQLQHSFNVTILQCQTVSVEMIKWLNELEHKVICLCNDVATELANSQVCDILEDEFTWGDFSTDFQNELSQSLKSELGKTDNEILNLLKSYSFTKLIEMVAAVNDREVKLLKSEASTWLCNSTQEYLEAMQVYLKSCKSKQDFIADHEKCILEAFHNFNSKWSSSSKNNEIRGQFIKQLRVQIDTQFEKLLEMFEFSKKCDAEKTALVKQEVRKYYHEEMKKHMKNRQFIQPQVLKDLNERARQTAIDNCRHALSLNESQKTILLQDVEKSYQKYEKENTMILNSELGSEPVIGIDLGTSYCRVAVCYKGKITVIKNAGCSKFTPSYVAFNPDGTHSVGNHAKEKAFQNPENTVYDIKRILERSFQDEKLQKFMQGYALHGEEGTSIEIYKKYYLPEEIAAILLQELVKQAKKIVQGTIKKAVVTVPAYFTNKQRKATKDAAEMAGLDVLQILDEPIAAAMSYNFERYHDDADNVLIFDLGGRKLEISILKIDGSTIKVIYSDENKNFGGESFDKAMVKYCLDEFNKQHSVDLLNVKYALFKQYQDALKQRLRRLQYYCEQGKIVLDVSISTVISVDSFYEGKDLKVTVTRQKFEDLNAAHFKNALEIVERSLNQAGLSKTQIADIIFVGGSTRIPKVKQMLIEYFGKALNFIVNPVEIVANGTAVQAAFIYGGILKKKVTSKNLNEVTAATKRK